MKFSCVFKTISNWYPIYHATSWGVLMGSSSFKSVMFTWIYFQSSHLAVKYDKCFSQWRTKPSLCIRKENEPDKVNTLTSLWPACLATCLYSLFSVYYLLGLPTDIIVFVILSSCVERLWISYDLWKTHTKFTVDPFLYVRYNCWMAWCLCMW